MTLQIDYVNIQWFIVHLLSFFQAKISSLKMDKWRKSKKVLLKQKPLEEQEMEQNGGSATSSQKLITSDVNGQPKGGMVFSTNKGSQKQNDVMTHNVTQGKTLQISGDVCFIQESPNRIYRVSCASF